MTFLTSEPQPIQHRFNVILFGDTGDGKSSIINLISGDHVARRPLLSGILDAGHYNVTIQGRDFCIFDTPGLDKPEWLMDPGYLVNAISNANSLVRYLSDTGGINLLVFCMRSGSITPDMQHNYLLFHDFLCHKKVPIALLVTHLEPEEEQNWWLFANSQLPECGIDAVDHAYITTKQELGGRYYVSRQAVHDILIAHGCGVAFTQERVGWVTELFQKSLDFIGFRPRLDSFPPWIFENGKGKDEIASILAKICRLDEDVDVDGALRDHQNALIQPTATTVCDAYRTI